MPQLINKHQLAELLTLKVSWIESKCRTRKIPHLLIAGQYRFTEQHVAEILAMHERRPIERPATATEGTPSTRSPRSLPTPGVPRPLRDLGLPTHRLRRPTP